jgi:antitoxin component of MazEF toxin-antitoxin module
MKSVHILQPYEVGSKKAKSLAMVIPAKVVKKYNISTSTAFALRADDERKELRLHIMEEHKDATPSVKRSAPLSEV